MIQSFGEQEQEEAIYFLENSLGECPSKEIEEPNKEEEEYYTDAFKLQEV